MSRIAARYARAPNAIPNETETDLGTNKPTEDRLSQRNPLWEKVAKPDEGSISQHQESNFGPRGLEDERARTGGPETSRYDAAILALASRATPRM